MKTYHVSSMSCYALFKEVISLQSKEKESGDYMESQTDSQHNRKDYAWGIRSGQRL